MSVHATTWVWEHAQVSGSALLVLLAIADAANREGEGSCQSVATLGRMARVSESTVHRSIKALLDAGLIEQTGVSGRYQTHVYRLPGMAATPVTGDTCQSDTPVTGDARPLSLVTPDPKEQPQGVDVDSRGRGAVVGPLEADVHPSRAITPHWHERAVFTRNLLHLFPGVDLDASRLRFIDFHTARKDTTRSWEASFRMWVAGDYARLISEQDTGTDEFGTPKRQRRRTVQPAQPGDPDYFDPEQYLP